MTRNLVLSMLAVGLLLFAVGCSDQSTEPQSTGEFDLNAEFGGLTSTSEQPAFGNPSLLASASDETDFDDGMLYEPYMDSLLGDSNSGIVRMRAVWGQLALDTSVVAMTDWSGSLTISRGGIVIRRTIRFELGQDYIVPRTNPDLLEWVPQTSVHNDGIVVDLVAPRPLSSIDTTITFEVDSLGDTTEIIVIDTVPPDYSPVEVAFETGPYSNTFRFDELRGLDTVITLEDSSEIAFTAFEYNPRCPRGALSGQWGVDEEGNNRFRGRWLSQHGEVVGWLQGGYGVDDNGRRVFIGKWISENGGFEGFVRGTWRPHPNHHANEEAFRHAGGMFIGKIYSANRAEIGVLRGRFKASDEINRGFFEGRWRLHCPDDDGFGDQDRDRDRDGDHDGPDDDDHGNEGESGGGMGGNDA